MAFTSRLIKLADITEFFSDLPKQRARGEKHFEANLVEQFQYDTEFGIIRARCRASQKQKIYSVEIEKVWCECPRGNVLCSHMAAAMFHAHYNISSTDQPCLWLSKAPPKDPITPSNILYCNLKPIISYSQNIDDNCERFKNAMISLKKPTCSSWLLSPETQETDSVVDVKHLLLTKSIEDFKKAISLTHTEVTEIEKKKRLGRETIHFG